MEYINMYKKWLNFDEDTKNQLKGLSEEEIKDRFYNDLEFGTGGLRGVIAAGTNRINVYTIRRVTKGLASYILKQNIQNPSVAIAFDSRRNSEVFAREAALALNANGIKTYIYDELEPTPMLSFAVRKLNATAGIVLTASHNPKEYNGYKVYWSDGGQITEEHAKGILDEIKLVDYENIKTLAFDNAVSSGLYNYISQDVIDDYIDRVKKLSINKKAINLGGDKIKIIYTPLHGTGNKPVRRVLSELGFTNVSVVKEQELPDTEFSTVKFPNPEEPEAFTLAIKMAEKNAADLIIGTDPDCDRIGVVVKNSKGEYSVLTGNQTGALLTYYMLSQMKENECMPKSPVVIKTVVTTELSRKICEDFNVEIIDVLTGFKYIGEKIKEFEINKNKNFIIGFEESYGYLAGTFVRDKDAVIAAALICEMAAYYKLENKTLYDALIDIYERYGYFKEDLKSVTLNGIEGSEKIKKIMNDLRNNPPLNISGKKVVRIKDYKEKTDKDILSNEIHKISLPSSNVIQLILDDESIITVRPSGTEPKIKFYFAVKADTMDKASEKIKAMKDGIMYGAR